MGLFNRKNIQNEINITAQDDCLIWQYDVDQEFSKTVRLNVGAGCQVLLFHDGKCVGTVDRTRDIDWKNASKNGGKNVIVGVNKDKHFKILFGAGGVPFNDRPARNTVNVGIHGECDCRVADGLKIFLAYGQTREKVTPDDVKEELHAKLQEQLVTALADKLQEYDYHSIFTSITEISQVVADQYKGILEDAGIQLVRCSISKPHFPDDYEQKRQELIAKATSSVFASTPVDDHDVIKEIFKNKGDSKPNVKICANCKKENDANAMFCKYCGKKIG